VTRWVGIRLGSQAVRVGQALGFQLVNSSGIEMETLALAGEGSPDALAEITHFLNRFSQERSDEQIPSMGQDIFKGRRTETDYINGFVAAKGNEIGVPAPLHTVMNELVKKVERGEIKPSPMHVANL
jgi:2-dehydropantoate 2-reductase